MMRFALPAPKSEFISYFKRKRNYQYVQKNNDFLLSLRQYGLSGSRVCYRDSRLD
jgi:hypothetical protein